MTDTDATFVVVGASLAGAKAVEALREAGFAGRVVLIGAETERPYERPPLSKGYLTGKEPADKAYVHPEGWYAEHDIDLRLGTVVTAVDRTAREVVLADGGRVRFDKLLLTTGSSVVKLKVPGADLDGVRYLRTFDDSTYLKNALPDAGQVAVIGGGWIGLEVASAARGYGASVVLIEPQRAPLHAVLGAELGEFFAQVHRDHGVDVRLGVGVAELRGGGGDSGRVDTVVTTDGLEVPADLVVVGVGVKPNVELAAAAGLLVDDGVVVDEFLRSTDPDIYAAGDIANAHNPWLGRQIRVQHWANALDQGSAAARSMLGFDEPYAKVPYFFSDQYDIGMEYSGFAPPGAYDQVVYRGDPASREFCAFWLAEDRIMAGMNVNVWNVHPTIRALIKSGARVDVQRLTDPSAPLDAVKA
jgi:3-phenylpropionate/trans-cinnamate dioxygenase ferredoxin reductase subunit